MDIQSVNNSMGLNNVFLNQKPIDNPLYSVSNLGKILNNKLKEQPLRRDTHPTPHTENLDAVAQKMRRLQIVNQQTEKAQEISEESRREFQSQLYFKKFTLANQEAYVAEHNEFVVHELIRNSFKPLQGEQRKLKRLLKQKMLGYTSDLPRYQHNAANSENVNKQNRRKYFQFIINKVNNDEVIDIGDQINLIQERGFWEILRQQIKAYDKAVETNAAHPELAIVKVSIDMLETQFSQSLPQQEEEINNFMASRYMESKNIDAYLKNDLGVYEWALAYAYLRAGRNQQLFSALTRMGNIGVELREAACKFIQGIKSLNPAPQNIVGGNISDPFYQQIVYLLKGQVKFTDRKLFEPGSLDLIWAILIFYKLFFFLSPNRQRDYTQMISRLSENIGENAGTITNPHEQFIYLSAYPQLIDYFQENQQHYNFNEDDFLHLLLVLNDRREILRKQDVAAVERTTQERLELYIKGLLIRSYPEIAPYYLTLLPSHHLSQSFLKIITNFSDLIKIDEQLVQQQRAWTFVYNKFIEKDLGDAFEEAFYELIQKLISKETTNNKQFKILEICQQIFKNDSQFYSQVVLHGFYSHLLALEDFERKNEWQNRPTNTQPNQYIHHYKSLLSSLNPESVKENINFLSFYAQLYKVLNYSHKRQKITKLKQLLEGETYIKEDGLNDLAQSISHEQGHILIFNYIRMVQTANELVNTARGNYTKIIEFKRYVKHSIEAAEGTLGDAPGYSQLLKMFDS